MSYDCYDLCKVKSYKFLNNPIDFFLFKINSKTWYLTSKIPWFWSQKSRKSRWKSLETRDQSKSRDFRESRFSMQSLGGGGDGAEEYDVWNTVFPVAFDSVLQCLKNAALCDVRARLKDGIWRRWRHENVVAVTARLWRWLPLPPPRPSGLVRRSFWSGSPGFGRVQAAAEFCPTRFWTRAACCRRRSRRRRWRWVGSRRRCRWRRASCMRTTCCPWPTGRPPASPTPQDPSTRKDWKRPGCKWSRPAWCNPAVGQVATSKSGEGSCPPQWLK